jgi:RNA polymerase sigma-70 factor (ECF subfamily)
LGLQASSLDEVRQQLRIRLLIGSPPRIGQYRGCGPLGAWVRMAAIRVGLSFVEGAKRHASAPELSLLAALVDDDASPEAMIARHRHAKAFQAALESSVATLESRDRTVLRMYFVDELNIDAIGRVFRVHRATIARRLQAIRQRVLETWLQAMKLDLSFTMSEIESLMLVVRQDLELSLRHLQRGSSEPQPDVTLARAEPSHLAREPLRQQPYL